MAVVMDDYPSTSYSRYQGGPYRGPLGFFGPAAPLPMGPPPPMHYHRGGHRGGDRGFQPRGPGHRTEGPPSLSSLRAVNKKRTKKHYRERFGQTPRTVPPAPDNSSGFLAPGSSLISPAQGLLHSVTPSTFAPDKAWKNGYGNVDKAVAEAAVTSGIDLFGSNAGMMAADEDIDFSDEGEHMEQQAAGHVPELAIADQPPTKQMLEEQQAYIAELEERNLNLQERVFLLEQQLREMQQQGQGVQGPAGEETQEQDEPAADSHDEQEPGQQQSYSGIEESGDEAAVATAQAARSPVHHDEFTSS